MFCKKCGNQIPEDMRFCTKCGTPAKLPTKPTKPELTAELPSQEKVTVEPPEAVDLPKDVWSGFDVPEITLTDDEISEPVELSDANKNTPKAAPKEYLGASNIKNISSRPVAPVKPVQNVPKEYAQPWDKGLSAKSSNVAQQNVQVNPVNMSAPQVNHIKPAMPAQPPMPVPVHNSDDAQKPKKKKKKNIGLKIVAIILVLAVLASGGLLVADNLMLKKQMEGKTYINEFPVLKQETRFTVYDEEKFPVEEYEIKVESLAMGGLLKSKTFVESKDPLIKEISTDPVYTIKFPDDGNYRITLTEVETSRTQVLTTTVPSTAQKPDENDEDEEPEVIIIDVVVDNDDPEARDDVNINSRPGEEDITAPAEEPTTTPQLNETVQATDADFKVFEDMLMKVMGTNIPEFNSNSADTKFVMENFVTEFLSVSGYDYYFNDVTVNYTTDKPDPLEKWKDSYGSSYAEYGYSYWTMNENNVKWICENIYHIRYDSSFNSDQLYAHNGYVYKIMPTAGGPGYASITMLSYSQDKGKYEIIVEAMPEVDESAETYKFVADLQNIDGQKQWTIYSISKTQVTEIPTQPSNEPEIKATDAEFKQLADILLSFNFTEFNSTGTSTAYAVDYMITNDIFSFGYDYFFKDIVRDPSGNDPLNKFGTDYVVMDFANVKWICENILNVSFDPSYSSAKSYVYNGKVYRKSNKATESLNYISTLSSYVLKDGRYEVTGEFYSAPNGETTVNDKSTLLGKYVINAELKMIDGKKQWSIYSVKAK